MIAKLKGKRLLIAMAPTQYLKLVTFPPPPPILLAGYYLLKVHKNENFFGFAFEFCTISMLAMHK